MTNDKSKQNEQGSKSGELSNEELKGASGGVRCFKGPELSSVEKKDGMSKASHNENQAGRPK